MTAAQRAEAIRRVQAANLRAAAGDPLLELRGGSAWKLGAPLPYGAGHLYPRLDGSDLRLARGASDALALRRRHSDDASHLRHLPAAEAARFVVELLEQLRCESLADLPGTRTNLEHCFWHWAAQFEASPLAETEVGRLLWAVALVARARIEGAMLPPDIEDRIEATRLAFPTGLGSQLAALRALRHDQRAFARAASAIASLVDGDIAALQARRGGRPAPRRAATPRSFTLHRDSTANASGYGTAVLQASRGDSAAAASYQVFTTAFDRQIAAAAGIRRALLERYRTHIGAVTQRSGISHPLLARGLQAVLTRPLPAGDRGGVERGRLDRARLAQLVATPQDGHVFRESSVAPSPFASLTFLVDCSGSMRRHAAQVAAFLEAMLRAADTSGVPTEVLGYTTGAWNGGRALAAWRRNGAPQHPGRLNELLHLVFKDFEQGWKSSRLSLAALLHEPRYKEGLDGEAVRWAVGRMARVDMQRRVLLVISDGSPSDSATANANGDAYLQHDLLAAVAQARASGVHVAGIGIGLDMSPYFGDANAALDPAQLATAQGVRDVLQLLQRVLAAG